MSDDVTDPERCREVVRERIAESDLLPIGYFHNVRNWTKASTVSHDDPDNLDMEPPATGNYGITASDIDQLLLVDIDDHKDEYDADALEYARSELLDTLTLTSAHGGEGRLYRVPRDEQGRLPSERLEEEFGAANISDVSWGEIRTEGQYIVGPGSQLDEDGCTKDGCTQCPKPDGGRYTIKHDRPIATLPVELLIEVLLQDRDVERDTSNRDTSESDGNSSEPADEFDETDGRDNCDGAPDASPYRAKDRLDPVRVADKTIVSQWTDESDHTSGENVKAFTPVWAGADCNGTANVVGKDGWKDTGGRGKGGPIEMAAIASDEADIDEKVQPGDVDGRDFVKAYEHLQECGFNLPDLSGSSLRDSDDVETESDAAMALDTLLELYEDHDDRSMDHWDEIWMAVGELSPETAEKYAPRVSDVCNVPEPRVVAHAEHISHEDEYGRIVVDDGKTWYLGGTPRHRYELLNFELNVDSILDVEQEQTKAQISAESPTGESFTTAVDGTVFNKKERFDDEILAELWTKFDIPVVQGSQPMVQDLLDAIRLWVHHQPAPRRTGVKHMGLHGDEFAISDRTLSAEGWTNDPEHVYLPSETGAERRVSLPESDSTDMADVAQIVETIPQTRDPERFLPVLGWFYAAPLRPIIESFTESGEFNHLSVTGDTGSGKTATLGYLWRMFGMAGEPFSVDSSSFAQLATFSSTNSIPLWFDEYKPSDIRDYKIDRFHDLYRKATRGAFAERGNPDQTTTTYKIQSPVVVSGEQQIQGPAERRRSIMTQFRQETTEGGTETAQRFKELIGQARVDGDEIRIGDDAPDPTEHALAFYRFACDIGHDELQELWYESLEIAHRRLRKMGVVDALDDLEIQGVQTVIFGYEIMHRFASTVNADRDRLPDRDTLDDAIGYMIDRIGPDGKRKSHADRFIELFGRAAASGDYVERNTHYSFVNEGKESEEIRINLPRTYDALSKYAADHDIDRSDLLNSHGDYRDRFEELADTPGSYVTATEQYTPPVSNCTGLKTTLLTDSVEFDRRVLSSDADTAGDTTEDDEGGEVMSSRPNADPEPLGDIDPETDYAASTIASVETRKFDGFDSGDDRPYFTTHLSDETGEAQLVVWDEEQMPEIFDTDGSLPDTLLIRDAKPDVYDDELQLIVLDNTQVQPAQAGAGSTQTADPGDNQQIDSTATDGGEVVQVKEQVQRLLAADKFDEPIKPSIVHGKVDAPSEAVDHALEQLSNQGDLIRWDPTDKVYRYL